MRINSILRKFRTLSRISRKNKPHPPHPAPRQIQNITYSARRITPEPKQKEPELIVLDDDDDQEGTITEEFTPAEYEKLQEVVENYKIKEKEAEHLLDQLKYMKAQIEYFKNSLDKKDLQMNKLIDSFQGVIMTSSERNHLEYYEKTKDKK